MFKVNTHLTTSLSSGKYDGSLSVFPIGIIYFLVTSDFSAIPEFSRWKSSLVASNPSQFGFTLRISSSVAQISP